MAESEFHKKVNFVAFSNSKLSLITVQVAIMRITVTDTHQSIGMIHEDFHKKSIFPAYSEFQIGFDNSSESRDWVSDRSTLEF